MSDEPKRLTKGELAERQTKGAQAERLLNDPLFREFLDKAEKQFVEQFMKSQVSDDETRLHARIALGVLGRIESLFAECIQSGEFATQKLLDLQNEEKKET